MLATDPAPFFVGTVQPTADASASIPARPRRISGNRAIATTDDAIPPSPLRNAGLPPGNAARVVAEFHPGGQYVIRRRDDRTIEVVRLGYPTTVRAQGTVSVEEMVELGRRFWETPSVLRPDQAPPLVDEIVFLADARAGDLQLRTRSDGVVELIDVAVTTADAKPPRNLLSHTAISGDDVNRVNSKFWGAPR